MESPKKWCTVDERFYLVKALEAEAVADAAGSPTNRRIWVNIAKEYRRLARSIAAQHRATYSSDHPEAWP